ncbi:iron-containing alcohol dehydrogenase [Pseudomonas sp. BN411]|uniref:iron-containing alcohol dehydrogenase n=1 Tax=Pseudomonas sp. BN411 TaxID=2567887 RepID=UPI002456A93C|nr:iron-containing alcohol dehydrogenase [Pseudomonas sp. BN411]MDH4560782.1 iron-containing alcohol dehydrogenase [Pseudomonas sp. BN411]
MSARVLLPRIMEIGPDACLKVPEILLSLGSNKPLIVTDKVMVNLGLVDRLIDALKDHGLEADTFDGTVPEPTSRSIEAGVARVQEGSFDSIVALGGGSVIDSAKAISILGKHGGRIDDYRFPRQVTQAGLPIIAVPTTAGTGSEVTRFTIITNEVSNEKVLCVGEAFMPIAAVIDFKLTLSLPARITADTGIDALTHAIEAYVSRKANPYSDSQALAAMRLIGPNLRCVYDDGQDERAREAMMMGATLAGIAFSNASVALVHGMSRPIGAYFHVPHGLSNAMLLPDVTAWSMPAARGRYADCARAIGAALPRDSNAQANLKLIAYLEDMNSALAVPTLQAFGADRQLFDQSVAIMAQQALASGSPGNNPRQASVEEIVDLYKMLWN